MRTPRTPRIPGTPSPGGGDGPRADAPRPARVVAPWVRTRLRTAPGAAAAMAVLVVLTAYLAAAFPRSVDAYETNGLRHDIRTATAGESVLEVTTAPPGLGMPQPDREEILRGAWVTRAQHTITRRLPAPVRADEDSSAYGVRTSEPVEGTDPWLPAPDNLPPMLTLAAQAGLHQHSTLREGRLPRAGDAVTARTGEVEAAVTAETAESLRLKVGSVVHVPGVDRDQLGVRITGIVAPLHPDNSYWSVETTLGSPALVTKPTNDRPQPRYWRASLLLAPDAAPVLLGTTGEPQLYWRIAPNTTALTARDAPRLASGIASLESGPELAELRAGSVVGPAAVVATGLDEIVAAHRSMRSAIAPVVAVAALGIGAVAGVVLVMAGGLIAARRQAELALLRSRGGSLSGIGGRLLAETAVIVVPAAAVGLLLAVLTVPQARLLPAVAAAGGAALLACAALPVRAVVRHRRPRPYGGREDLVRARPSRRRTIAELTLLALAIGAVVALRRRGTGGPAGAGSGGDAGGLGDVDYLVSSAPVLVGLIAALVLVRLYPLPLRLAGRPAGRLRGAVGFLSLARAGRASSSGALPLLALLIALTTAAFGGSVLAGIDGARDRAAVLATGADARVNVVGSSPVLPGGLAEAVRSSAGVGEVTAVRIEYGVPLPSDSKGFRTSLGVTMIGVEPGAYARLARQMGLGEFSAADLKSVGGGGVHDGGSDPGRVLPTIASPAVAERLGDQPREIQSAAGDFKVRVAGIRPNTPASPSDDFLLVNAADLTQRAPTTLLVTGAKLDGGALRRTVTGFGETSGEKPAGPLTVKLRTEERRSFVNTPMQEGAERIYAAAIAAGAGYALLALLLSLSQAAPERVTLLARLRTMGLTMRQARQLLGLEVLPQALLAAVGGAFVGWATVVLLAPGVDLVRLALTATSDIPLNGAPLRADPWSLVLPAVGVLVLAAGVSVVQAWWAGRQGSINELRAGDSR